MVKWFRVLIAITWKICIFQLLSIRYIASAFNVDNENKSVRM